MAMSNKTHSTVTLKDNDCVEDDISSHSYDIQSQRRDKMDCTHNEERYLIR